MPFDWSRACYDHSGALVIWKGKASGNQGVVLLNKRLNLPITGALSLPFMLQNTRTTRLGYILLVFSLSQHTDHDAEGHQNIR
jgi:hypothetical protein